MNLSAGERVGSIVAGMALLGLGDRMPRARLFSRVFALGLVARGASGYCPVTAMAQPEHSLADTKAALGGPSGLHVREGVTIARPRTEIYQKWRDLHALPELLPHVQEINRIGDRRSQWTSVGDSGLPIEWEAELVNEIENELVAWRSVRSRVVTHAGSVRFRDVPGGTEILVHLQYRPVAGALGALAARLLGYHPSSQVREDLRRMKQLLEAGEVPTVEGQPSGPIEPTPIHRHQQVAAS